MVHPRRQAGRLRLGPDDGRPGFETAVRFVERMRGRSDGRVQALLAPAQVDTCSEALLRDSKAAADDLDVPLSLHASQGVWEFQEMTRRHGRSPVEWLSDIGFLGPRTLLGHAVFVTGNSWVNFAGDDLGLLASSGTSVSYNAWCFIRRGLVMESFPSYVAAGDQHVPGHRHRPAVDDRVAAVDRDRRQGRFASYRREHRAGGLRRRDGQCRRRARPARPRPDRAGSQGRPAVLARRRLHDDAAARPDPQPRLLRPALRPRRRAGRRAAGGGGRRGDRGRRGRRPYDVCSAPASGCGTSGPRATGPAAPWSRWPRRRTPTSGPEPTASPVVRPTGQ